MTDEFGHKEGVAVGFGHQVRGERGRRLTGHRAQPVLDQLDNVRRVQAAQLDSLRGRHSSERREHLAHWMFGRKLCVAERADNE